ncbi:MAG: site-2 protease family protein [Desulfobacterales bacterium]|jgi:Zn-dependent protease/CBS domain-containing protein|nr:site-2 protease family protein [Desulfobacterales bacterium]
MFGKQLRLFKLMGFEVKVDLSWVIIAVLIAWSLSSGFFPARFRNYPAQTYWIMGFVGAIGLFISIIAHEFSHSLAARKYGLPIKGITLFLFGGVAEMGEEPKTAKAEFMMAIVGPISSIMIGMVCYIFYYFGLKAGVPYPVTGVIYYLAMINGVLAGFNMLPAFPLDGGRVLRSILWHFKGDLKWATRIASGIGSFFGLFLILVGVFDVITGNFVSGMWSFLIGLFLKKAAENSYQQMITHRALEGESLRRFMTVDPVTVSPSTTIGQLVEDYVYKHHFKMYPVVDRNQLVGCITTHQVREIPRDQWPYKTVGEVAVTCEMGNTIGPDADVNQALSQMLKNNSSRIMVVDKGRLLGIIALKDLMEFLSLKIELES